MNEFISLPAYWDGIASALDARIGSVKKSIRHSIAGTNAETWFRDLLREYLPSRYAVETGFVLNTSGQRSDHIDIIIADTFHVAPLCSEPSYKVFAAESVCAAIEVTTSPVGRVKGIPKLQHDIEKLSRLRSLCRNPKFFDVRPISDGSQVKFQPVAFTLTGSPRCYLITCGSEWKSSETYENHLASALKDSSLRTPTVWINAALSLTHGLFKFVPDTKFTCRKDRAKALLKFVLLVNQGVATWPTFKVDINRYARGLPSP